MKKIDNNIYEQIGVYGDENKFLGGSDRLEKMTDLVGNLEFKPTSILDIGCGTGYFANRVRKIYPNAKIYGIDISNNALSLGKKNYKQIKFLKVNAEERIPFGNEYFDLVISGEHIEHLKDTDTYLSEINRVMKKRGILILTTPNLASWLNRIFIMLGRQPFFLDASFRKTLPIFSVFGFTFPEDLSGPSSGHLRLFTLDMLTKLLKTYKFKIKEIKGRTILSKPFFRHIDLLFAQIPSLASGIIVKAKKDEV